MTDILTPVLTAHWDQPDLFTIDGYRRAGPLVGRTGLPARRSSTSWRAESGVMLSKNSQFTIMTGA